MRFKSIPAFEKLVNRLLGTPSYKTLQPHRMAGDSAPMYVVVEFRRSKLMPHVFQWQVPDIEGRTSFDWNDAIWQSQILNREHKDSPASPVYVPMEWQTAIQLFPSHVRESLVSMFTFHLVNNT